MSLLSIMTALNVLREDPSSFLCKQALTWSSQELPKVPKSELSRCPWHWQGKKRYRERIKESARFILRSWLALCGGWQV